MAKKGLNHARLLTPLIASSNSSPPKSGFPHTRRAYTHTPAPSHLVMEASVQSGDFSRSSWPTSTIIAKNKSCSC